LRNFHARPLQQGGGDQRPQHGTGAVHAAVQAIGAALHVLGRGIGQDSVARRASQALAEPVGAAQDHDRAPVAGQADERPRRERKRVADEHHGLASLRTHIRAAPRTKLQE